MLKKIFVFAVILAVMAVAYGCGCNATATPTPTPTGSPSSSPTVEVIEPSPEANLLPDSSTSPDAAGGMGGTGGADGAGTAGAAGAAGTGGTGTGTGTDSAGGTGASINNFSEGTEVQTGDAPQVESAIKSKYENATIQTIKHATRNNEQVYAVEIKSGTTTQTVYVRPDGTVLE